MRASHVVVGALLLFMPLLPASRAGCCYGDPSAVDLDPSAEPLRLARSDADDSLVLTWESTSTGYRVWQGDATHLHATGRFDDEIILRVSTAETQLPVPPGNVYFIVTSDCFDLHCTRGRDSDGVERATPGCEILERGDVYADAAMCLGPGNGIVRTDAEYLAFASCFFSGGAPDPPGTNEALVWATDYSNAACGTCLEFPCTRRFDDELIVETAGAPWGDCDAIHYGGTWARVPDAPVIVILEEMPPIPAYQPCP